MKHSFKKISRILVFGGLSVTMLGCGTENPLSRGPEIISDGGTSHVPGEAVSFSGQLIPILSVCESCHASGTGGWTYGGGAEAYTEVLTVINSEDPAESALLVKGSGGDGHGGGQFFSVSSVEYQAILDWITQGAANN